MTNNTYNGWHNYETWLTNLHFDNCWEDQAEEIFEKSEACETFSKVETAALELAEFIENDVNDYIEASGALPADAHPFIQDIVNTHLTSVNWYEIAKSYVSELESEAA